jgi:hypothetical protein
MADLLDVREEGGVIELSLVLICLSRDLGRWVLS